MARLICHISEGARPAEATVEVRDFAGRAEYLPVDRGFLAEEGGKHFLPVGVVQVDPDQRAALVMLPVETDSGAHQIWVSLADLQGNGEAKG
jgi:hypothetical protein